MKTIVYLLYGSRREYHLELTYSVLSAVHFIGNDRSNYRIALITDEENRRPDLPIEHLFFTPDKFHSWTRSGKYTHEAKVHALMMAIDYFKGAVALIDTDTYFLKHPANLFERIGAGTSVMHSLEGKLERFDFWSPLLERVTAPVDGYRVAKDSEMLNSGVVGVDFAERHLLNAVVQLIGKLHTLYPIFNVEQFAFAAVLNKNTKVLVCPDIVYHYWGYERAFFHCQIGRLFPTFTSELFNQYVENLPRLGLPKKRRVDQVKAMVVSFLRRHGNDYRFAYIAYLCALSQSSADPLQASVWARIALAVLGKNSFPVKHIQNDFVKMRHALDYQWLDSEAKQDWIRYWEGIGTRD